MNIFAISGSASQLGSNYYLLKSIQDLLKEDHRIDVFDKLSEFELFTPDRLENGVPHNIQTFKSKVINADAIIISTPEYTHNIPAVLKNMIEWCTHSGEFAEKNVLPITFTPQAPRGEHAMQSLLFSLKTMNAKVIGQMLLYKTDVHIENEKFILPLEIQELIIGAAELF